MVRVTGTHRLSQSSTKVKGIITVLPVWVYRIQSFQVVSSE